MRTSVDIVPAYAQVSLRDRSVRYYPVWDEPTAVLVTDACVLVGTAPESDGPVVLSVQFGRVPPGAGGLIPIAVGHIMAGHGTLLAGNVSTSEVAIDVPVGRHDFRVLVDDSERVRSILIQLSTTGVVHYPDAAEGTSPEVRPDTDRVLRDAAIGTPLAEQRYFGSCLHAFYAEHDVQPGDRFRFSMK